MNKRQLQVFLAVAETGSFADAATLIHLSQPAVSLSIKGLEEDLGGALFVRSTRSLHLTQEGQALLPTARSLLAAWADAEHELKQRFKLNIGKLAIAVMPSLAASLLPSGLRIYRQRYPNIKVEVHDVLTDTVVEMVRSGHIEIGLSFLPKDTKELTVHTLFNDRFIAVVPKEHPLSQKQELTWQVLLRYDVISLQRPSSVRSMIEGALADADMEFNVAFDAHQLATVGRMVAEGLGVAVVPSLCHRQMLEQGAVCLPIKAPMICRDVAIITRAKVPLSVAAEAMVATLLETFAALP
ncbi:LysR family transcriptional regulator [Marinomonas agarivorans]|nr:LysR family transcriptional regulator [Marinomonas agarivorans]